MFDILMVQKMSPSILGSHDMYDQIKNRLKGKLNGKLLFEDSQNKLK